MNHKSNERGQALILIALAAIGLFAFSALAIDGSRSFSNKRHAQNSADTAVLTAALKYIRTGHNFSTAETAAEARAASNGYVNDNDPSDGYTTIVDVDRCDNVIDIVGGKPIPGDVIVDSAGVPILKNGNLQPLPCEGIGTNPASEYIRVKIISTIPTTFGRVLGRNTLTSAVEAIARVQGGTASSGGDSYASAAMVSTSQETNKTCFMVNGSAYIYTHNSGVSVNCADKDKAMFFNSNIQLYMDKPGEIVGCYNDKNLGKVDPLHKEKGWFDPLNCGINSGTPKDFTHDFDDAPTMPTPNPCNDPSMPAGKNTGGVLTPGNFTGNILIDGNTEVKPGLYCMHGNNLNVNSGNMTQKDAGAVTFVFEGSGSFLGSKNTHSFKDLEIFTVNGDFSVGDSHLTADILRFYSSGIGNSIVDSHGTLTSGNAYMYLKGAGGKGGDVKWNSQSIITLHAATDGTYRGLLIHKPWGNTTRITFNGGTNHTLTGTFLAPDSPVTFNGNTTFSLHSQIIAADYIVDGGAKVDIWYDPTENYLNPKAPPTTIDLSK